MRATERFQPAGSFAMAVNSTGQSSEKSIRKLGEVDPDHSHCPAASQNGARRVRTACLEFSNAEGATKTGSYMCADRVRHGGRS